MRSGKLAQLLGSIVLAIPSEFKPKHDPDVYDFRMRMRRSSTPRDDPRLTYLPFQFGLRLLRNASMPSRKSSLM